MARRVVEHRLVGGHLVFDRLAEVPRLRRDRGEVVALGSCSDGTNGISIGVGLPIVSVSRPIMLWK